MRCWCKVQYASKFTAASRGHPCDSTALGPNRTSYVFLFPLVVSFVLFVFTARATQSAVMPRQVVRPSVSLSACLSVSDNEVGILRKYSRLISVGSSLLGVPRSAIWSNGNTPKFGWNRGGSFSQQKTCNISETRQDMGQGYYWWLIGSCIRAFDSYQINDRRWP